MKRSLRYGLPLAVFAVLAVILGLGIAPVYSLFRQPAHPYTALLLASVPKLDVAPKADLATIEGSVPTPNEFGGGCRFVGRCPLATDKCRSEPPPLFEHGKDHFSACWHIDRMAEMRKVVA